MSKEKQLEKLRKENDTLKSDLQSLQKEFETIKQKLDLAGKSSTSELQQSVDFVSAEYDSLKADGTSLTKEVQEFSKKLNFVAEKVYEIDNAVESITAYSYQYNIRIVGLPQLKRDESDAETVSLCLKLFNEMGADVKAYDIDIAHRLQRREDGKPSTIICKFTRRIAKEAVMAKRKETRNVDLKKVIPDFIQQADNIFISLSEHLTPRKQALLNTAKLFQKELNYAYCWVKNGNILLRENQNGKVIRVENQETLDNLKPSASPSPSDAGFSGFPSSPFSAGRGRGQPRGRGTGYMGPRTRSYASSLFHS